MRRLTCLLVALMIITPMLLIGCGEESSPEREPGTTSVDDEVTGSGTAESEAGNGDTEEAEVDEETGGPAEGSPVGVINDCISAVESGDLNKALSCFSEGIQEDYADYGYYYDFEAMLGAFDITFNNVVLSLASQQGQYAEVMVTGGSVTVTGAGLNVTVDLVGPGGPESIELKMNSDGTWGIDNGSSGLDDIGSELLDDMDEALYE